MDEKMMQKPRAAGELDESELDAVAGGFFEIFEDATQVVEGVTDVTGEVLNEIPLGENFANQAGDEAGDGDPLDPENQENVPPEQPPAEPAEDITGVTEEATDG